MALVKPDYGLNQINASDTIDLRGFVHGQMGIEIKVGPRKKENCAKGQPGAGAER